MDEFDFESDSYCSILFDNTSILGSDILNTQHNIVIVA